MIFRQLQDPATQTYTYLLGNRNRAVPANRQCGVEAWARQPKEIFMSINRLLPLAFAALALLLPVTAVAGPDNARALQGLEKGKVVWNITLADPQQLAGQMQVIHQTYKDLKGAGIKPKMVLGFHSPNVNYLAENLDHIDLKKTDAVMRFQKQLAKVADLEGVRVEACGIANQFFGMKGKDMRDDVTVVANGYVSFIAYQHKGYGMIGIH